LGLIYAKIVPEMEYRLNTVYLKDVMSYARHLNQK